jgi:chromate reductase, NAD(P)H dehydrogenase (quinone)
MLIIVHGTNRPSSMSYRVAVIYRELLLEQGVEAGLFSLEDLPLDFMAEDMQGREHAGLTALLEDRIVPEQKLVFVMPEYNGSIPGLLKAFIDASDVERCFRGKKAALVGVAAGRAGNLRGLDHLTDILHHMGTEVLSAKIPISGINKLLGPEGFVGGDTEGVLKKQIEQFIRF